MAYYSMPVHLSRVRYRIRSTIPRLLNNVYPSKNFRYNDLMHFPDLDLLRLAATTLPGPVSPAWNSLDSQEDAQMALAMSLKLLVAHTATSVVVYSPDMTVAHTELFHQSASDEICERAYRRAVTYVAADLGGVATRIRAPLRSRGQIFQAVSEKFDAGPCLD